MQTMYYKTSSFIQHTGNVVDLEEYRRKAALARESSSLQQDSLARQPQAALWPEEPAFQPVVLSSTPEERPAAAPGLDPGRLRQPGRGADDAGLCPAGYAVTAATISWVFC